MITRYYGPRDRSAMHRLDTYDTDFEVVVCHDISRARNTPKRIAWFECGWTECDAIGLTCATRSKIGVFLERGKIDHNLIAHEAFHATHRLMDWAGVRFDIENQEPYSHLNGYINQLIYQDLHKWKIKIKH